MSAFDQLLFYVNLFAAFAVLWRLIIIGSQFDHRDFAGHKIRYTMMVTAFSIIGFGAITSIADWDKSDNLLTLGEPAHIRPYCLQCRILK